jgi:lambda family phage portal protein
MSIISNITRWLSGAPEVRSLAWHAAGGGTRLSNWGAQPANFANPATPPILRDRARDSFRNNPVCRRAIDALVVNAVGAGVKPQPQNRAALEVWNRWTDEADFSGQRDFYGFQQDALRAMLIDGEAIIRFVVDPSKRVPLQLQLLGGEFLDGSRVDRLTRDGIEFDSAGRRIAYWLYEKHPADFPTSQSIRVPSDQVVHLFAATSPGQQRGITRLAPALIPLKELQEYLEAALVRQKVASLFCGYVQTGDGSNPLNSTNGVPSLEPGSMVRLQPGEIVEFSSPPEVGISFDPFVRQQLRAIAGALNLPYEILTGDMSQITFASGRHGLLEFRRQLESLQHHILVFQLCRPVWNAWVNLALAAGALPLSSDDYADVRWVAPLPEMLDPKGEVAAIIQRIRAGLMSRSEAVSLTGLDIEQVDAEIAADNARADALGLVLDSDPRKVTVQGQAQADGTGTQGAA